MELLGIKAPGNASSWFVDNTIGLTTVVFSENTHDDKSHKVLKLVDKVHKLKGSLTWIC
jgi:hypothetical protein